MFEKVKRLFKREIVETLKYHIEYENEISVEEFSNYLLGINKEYKRFVGKKHKTELSVISIEKGSIDLILTTKAVLDSIDVINNIVTLATFSSNLFSLLRKYKDNPDKMKQDLDAKEINKSQVQLVRGVTGGKAPISITNIQLTQYINGTEIDTETISNANMKALSSLYLPELKEPVNSISDSEIFESVLFRFHKITEPTNTNKTTDYSGFLKIDGDIYKDAKKVVFLNTEIRNSFDFNENPFDKHYLIDVKIHKNNNGSISKYEIIGNMGLYETPLLSIMK